VAVIEVPGASEIHVGRSFLDAGTVLGSDRRSVTVAVACQPTVVAVAEGLAGALREAGARSEVRVLPDGEAAKELPVIAELYQWLADLGMHRSDVLVGVGGGALTDAAGFAAATYLRGIEFVNVPTTLLGAVDASVGGKTGVNLGAKNLVGAFAHPTRVVIDVDVLELLPPDLKRQGAAEALKAGMIGDERLVALLETEGLDADLEEVVVRAVAVKADVVGRDFTERGERAFLNYGHTVGHALEVALDLSHGEAVAVGMVAAGRVSAIRGGFAAEARQNEAIARLGLPLAAPDADPRRVRDLLGFDKKRDATGLRMVLLDAIGVPKVEHVAPATVEAALAAVGIDA
jgi:3-dehydroquinate synthase